jgi:hypothetical protein
MERRRSEGAASAAKMRPIDLGTIEEMAKKLGLGSFDEIMARTTKRKS